ncbi:MAG: hypothetical protein WB767_06240 [Nocardioides sp.]
MFTHTCSACESRKLIFPSQISGIDNTAEGIVVNFTCWCGAAQTTVTGRRAALRSDVVRAA